MCLNWISYHQSTEYRQNYRLKSLYEYNRQKEINALKRNTSSNGYVLNIVLSLPIQQQFCWHQVSNKKQKWELEMYPDATLTALFLQLEKTSHTHNLQSITPMSKYWIIIANLLKFTPFSRSRETCCRYHDQSWASWRQQAQVGCQPRWSHRGALSGECTCSNFGNTVAL